MQLIGNFSVACEILTGNWTHEFHTSVHREAKLVAVNAESNDKA